MGPIWSSALANKVLSENESAVTSCDKSSVKPLEISHWDLLALPNSKWHNSARHIPLSIRRLHTHQLHKSIPEEQAKLVVPIDELPSLQIKAGC